MEHWSLIHSQPLLKTIFLKLLITSYKKGKIPQKRTCESKNIICK